MDKTLPFCRLAARIRKERKSQGLGQKELADISQVSLNFINQLENGKSTVRLDKLLLVLQALGLELQVGYGKQGIKIL